MSSSKRLIITSESESNESSINFFDGMGVEQVVVAREGIGVEKGVGDFIKLSDLTDFVSNRLMFDRFGRDLAKGIEFESNIS